MLCTLWGDPFDMVMSSDPGRPVSLSEIRERQQALIPSIAILKSIANDVVTRAADSEKSKARRGLFLEEWYRPPDQPNWILPFHPFPINDHAVVIPTDHKTPVSVLDRMFPILPTEEAVRKGGLLALVSLEIMHTGEAPEHAQVVFPALLNHVLAWITEREGTLNHMICEAYRPDERRKKSDYKKVHEINTATYH
jgi:hypothetical protein